MHLKKMIIGAFLLILIVFTICGCKVKSLTRDQIVANDFDIAMIDSELPIKASQLYYRLADSDLLENGGQIDSAMYFDTLRAIILDSLVSLEAMKVDLKDDMPLYRNFFFLYREFYLNYIYKNLIIDSIPADSALVIEYYESHSDVFFYREQIRARHIVVSAEGLRFGEDSLLFKDYSMEYLDSLAKKKIYDFKDQIDSGAEFGNIAYDYSVHRESGKRLGELGYFFRNTYNKAFEDVAFNIPEGQVSDPFKSPDGWHIVEVIDHVDSGLADLTPEIFQQAMQGYLAENSQGRHGRLIDSLLKNSTIIYNDEALSGNIHKLPETLWAAVINDRDTITCYRLPDYMHQYKSSVGRDSVDLPLIHDMFLTRAVEYLLMQAGDDIGYGDKPEVAKKKYGFYHKYALNFVKKGSRDPQFRPPDSLVENYYNENIETYVFKKPIYVQHIIVDDSVFGEFLRDQALSGIEFLDLAKEHYPGAEEIRVAAADLGFIGPGEMPDAFYSRAVATPIGGISRPVKTEFGYHIIKIIDRRYNRTIDQVRPTVVDALKKEHAKEFKEQWKQSLFDMHKVEYFLENLKRIELAEKSRR